MGCGGSKADDSPLVNLCRERKQLIKAAVEHRYALAAAHLSYFTSLKDVGDALCRFVEEELVVAASSSSSSPASRSPVLTLPPDKGRRKHCGKGKKPRMRGGGGQKRRRGKEEEGLPSSSSSLSSVSHEMSNRSGVVEGEGEGSHLHLSDSEVSSAPSGHIEIEDDPEFDNVASHPMPGITYTPNVFMGNSYDPYSYPYSAYESNYPSSSFGTYYMKKAPTAAPSVIYEEPTPNPIYMYADFPRHPPSRNAGYYGFMGNMTSPDWGGRSGQQSQQPRPPPTPPSPEVSAWDYLNPFEVVENNFFPEYYTQRRYPYGSNSSSPDSKEVREREGIPDLEEETENEVVRESFRQEKGRVDESLNSFYRNRNRHRNKQVLLEEGKGDNFGDGTSNVMPLPVQDPQEVHSVERREIKSNSPGSDASISNRREHMEVENREVGLDVEGAPPQDVGSPKISNFTVLSTHGTRDLREVAREIKDEFDAATDYGKEVTLLLEAGKLPYRSRGTFLGVTFSRFLYSVAPALSSSLTASDSSPPSSSGRGEVVSRVPGGSWNRQNSGSLASTLDKLYMWEKKLYEEVKDEERLRISYEKWCKKLKHLDERGADASKIEATQASIRKLVTKIDVSIRAVEAISSRINKLRDEEFQPQIIELIYGLRKMWNSMLKCHQRQFQAILESRTRALKANTGLRRDSNVRAALALEMELLKWCSRFNQWIDTQRFYAESLNGWLFRCLLHEPEEETPDGVVPFSPGKIGAPPAFVICHDWNQVMDRISESGVKTAMQDFVMSLHQLWDWQDEEQRQRVVKSEYAFKDFEKQIQTLRDEKGGRTHNNEDTASDKVSLSMVPSNSGISPLDDLTVDLDTMRQKVQDQRPGQKEAVKLVHNNAAVSKSIQAGLIPIFEALESFTSEAAKAYENVRVQIPSNT
ncbi:hypothetical protein Dimus_005263 [Dionaea muscipula]